MKLETLKTKLSEWFFPRSFAAAEMMKEIQSAKDELKKEMLLERQTVYHYCTKQGRQWRNGLVGVCHAYREPNGKIYIRSYDEKIDHIKTVICIHTGFRKEKMVIVSLTELK